MDQSRNSDREDPVKDETKSIPPPVEPEAPPLTPMGWLAQNGPYFILFAFLGYWIYSNAGGWIGVYKVGLVALGLGFVIFIHELGHFLAAKWCDVHVQTFSIGFGPAIPGCSFVHGETTYKIAAFPLGGYVNMVGEGLEGEDNEDYPRSFKNKTVGQRMLIISAGVIMNVLLGCACFVFVYLAHGERVLPAIVYRIESGSPAWQAGVRTGSIITRIGSTKNPTFDDLRMAVALSDKDEKIPFVFQSLADKGALLEIDLEPRRDDNDVVPVVGIAPPEQLKLYPAPIPSEGELPVYKESVAAAARPIDLGPNDVLMAASEPGKDGLTLLVGGREKQIAELSERLTKLKGLPLQIQITRATNRAVETIEVPHVGFDFEDEIVGTSDVKAGDPFQIAPLPFDSRETGKARDAFEFRNRLKALASKPMVIQVRRKHGEIANLLVPQAHRHTFGMKMQMGAIVGVRKGSSAEQAGVQARDETNKVRGDVLSRVAIVGTDSKIIDGEIKDIDPVRLPHELSKRAESMADPSKLQVKLWVLRPNPGNHKDLEEKELPLVPWENSWSSNVERPVGTSSPMSIPQLGLAYQVESTVVAVEKGSAAEAAGIQSHDRIDKISLRKAGPIPDDWTEFFEMKSKRPDNPEAYDQWAHYFWWMERVDSPEIRVKITRGGVAVKDYIEMKAQPDLTWPMSERGLILQQDYHLQRAHSLGEALGFGVNRTVRFIKQIYLNLKNFMNGRISRKLLGGPIEIAKQAFSAAEDFYTLVLFLGIISVNLAVVNFLPIPVLDGGHMVFLIYEKLRGKAVPESVRAPATYLGLAMLASLMLFVFYQDIMRLPFIKKLIGG